MTIRVKFILIATVFLFVSTDILYANPISALKHLFKQGDEVAKLGKYGDDAIPSTRYTYHDPAVAGLSRSEVDELNTVLSGMHRYSNASLFDDIASIRTLRTSFRDDVGQFNRTVPLSDEFPFINIRAHSNVKYDAALRSFTLSKYHSTLSSKFDIEDVKVISLGLSDDAVLSASESARFKRTLGRQTYDQVGPLSRISSTNYKSMDDYKKALEPYRGKTVIFVGHIPDDINSFFVFRNGIREKVNIKEWMNAADEMGVNLMPIGCNSERLSQMGVEGIINSGDVLDRLKAVIIDQPDTVGKFFQTFSSNDISLVFNSLNARIFANSAEIISRQKMRTIGKLVFETAKSATRIRSWWDDDYSYQSNLSSSDYGLCFNESSSDKSFDSCVVNKIAQREKEISIREVQERESRRKSIVLDINQNTEALKKNSFIYFLILPTHLLAMFLCPLFFIVGFTAARWDEEENGVSFRRIFLPITIKNSMINLYYSFKSPLECWVVLLFALGAVVYTVLIGVFLPLYLNDVFSYDYEGGVFVAMIMIGVFAGKLALVLFWESIREGSLAFLVSGMAPILLLGSSYLFVHILETREEISSEAEWLLKEHDSLQKTRKKDLEILSLG